MAKKNSRSRKLGSRQPLVDLREQIIKPWRLAIFSLRSQLAQEMLSHTATRRRFQHRRLIENLVTELKQTPNKARSAVMSYWVFCGSPWQDQLGYDCAREQHFLELKALGFSPEFEPPQRSSSERIVAELTLRLDSLASWIEAQESWVFWNRINREPAAWDRDDPQTRRQALGAATIAGLRSITEGLSDLAIARVVESFGTWSNSQWIKLLKMAVRIASKPDEPISKLESWVWWRYPIFSRYRWSAAEVCRAAKDRFGEVDQINNQAAFQSAWVRRGLRFTGKRTRRKRPPLWEFVLTQKVPNYVASTYPMLTWIPYENSSARA